MSIFYLDMMGSALSSFLNQETSGYLVPLWLFIGLLLHPIGSLVLLPPAPASVTSSAFRQWKWQSTYLERIASALTGIWATAAIYTSSEMRQVLKNLITLASSEMMSKGFKQLWPVKPEICDRLLNVFKGWLYSLHINYSPCFINSKMQPSQ